MLDTDIDRLRADRLRKFLGAQKRAAEADRLEALKQDRPRDASESTGSIEAYEAVLSYVDAKSTERGRSLDRIRDAGEE
jgi:hypothetical protein